jgi:uncharacterized RDD family membrane protein YckC
MAKLIVNPTSSSRREIVLPRSLLSIGRDPSNDLVLPDAMVSRRHAVVEYRGSQYYLRDCNSSNGSLVNGDRVSERNLRDGDLVAIGTARLLFRDDVAVEDAGAKVVQHPSAPRLACPSCGAEHRKSDQFCRQCGAQLVQRVPPKVVCASCGTVVPLPANFCNACGQSLATGRAALEPTKQRDRPADPAAGTVLVVDEEPGQEPAAEGAAPEGGRILEGESPGTDPAHAEARIPAVDAPPAGGAASSPVAVAPVPSSSPALAEPGRLPPASRPTRPDATRRPTTGSLSAAVAHAPAERSWARTPRSRPSPIAESAALRSAATGEPAGFGRRLAAGLIDLLIAGAGFAMLTSPAALLLYDRWSRQDSGAAGGSQVLPVLVTAVCLSLGVALVAGYFTFFWGTRGATPGKRILELVVVNEDGSYPIGPSRAVIRFVGCLLSLLPLGLGFLSLAFWGTTLHDRWAGTRVVRRPGD